MEWFVHFDLNKFYASIIRAFRPWLETTPIVVLSNNDWCSICQTKEAQAFGIKIGTAVFEIEDLIDRHGIELFSTNFPLIADMSRRVKGILGRYFDELEDYSIDEVFGKEKDVPVELVREKAHTVVDIIERGLHLPISCGIARTKTLAKVATRFAKNYKGYNRVCAITDDEQRLKALQLTKLEDIWRIGRRHTERLSRMGINTAWDFAEGNKINSKWIKKRMTVVGLKTYLELNGESCLDLELVIKKKKNIMVSRGFGNNKVTDFSTISHALTNYIFMNAAKLRAQGSKTQKIYVFLEKNSHNPEDNWRHIEIPLPVATSSNRELNEYGQIGLKALYQKNACWRKVGFMTMNFSDANAVQGNIWDTRNRKKEDLLDKTWDHIIGRYGRDAIRTGGQGWDEEDWHIRQQKLCPCWTTREKDFLKVVDYPVPLPSSTDQHIYYTANLISSCAFKTAVHKSTTNYNIRKEEYAFAN